MTRIKFDLVLPCYNPSEGWERVVVANIEEITSLRPDIELNLIIVNDGSKKGFTEESINYIISYIDNVNVISYANNRGKGYALREGIKECKSNCIIYSDFDFPYTTESFIKVVDAIESGSDVVVAVRDANYQKGLPFFRKLLSFGSHLFNIIIFRITIRDTQGGLKGMSAKGREIFLSTKVDTFLFDTEFIYKAFKIKGVKISTVSAKIKRGLNISPMGLMVIKKEFKNVYKILSSNG